MQVTFKASSCRRTVVGSKMSGGPGDQKAKCSGSCCLTQRWLGASPLPCQCSIWLCLASVVYGLNRWGHANGLVFSQVAQMRDCKDTVLSSGSIVQISHQSSILSVP